MRIPIQKTVDARRARRTVEVHVSNALLQQAAREQAIPRVSRLEWVDVVGPVESPNNLSFRIEVGHLRRRKLHPGGQLVSVDACSQLRKTWVPSRVFFVKQ